MVKNSLAEPKTVLKTKITLIIFGVFLFLILLEVGLRLGGFVLLSLQEHRNLQTIKQKGTYRIMCLGESTTQGQYPLFLEEILNKSNTGIKFSVIDKGIDGTKTPYILSQIESYLDEYHPDMIVTMMGVNDLGRHIPYEATTTSKVMISFKSLRTYKLWRLLWLHILTKAKETGLYKPSKDKQGLNKLQTYLPGIGLKETYTEPMLDEDSFKKALEINPKNDGVYVELGQFYRNQGKLLQAEDSFKKALEINPKNYGVYVELGWLYQERDNLSQVEDSFKKALELNPKNDQAYVGLGWFYQNQGKLLQAEDSFKKALEINPKNDRAYVGLEWFYQNQGKLLQAEDSFKKALELNPKNDGVYVGLGWFYQNQGKLLQAEDSFKKALELNPKNDGAYGAISLLYEEVGKLELAKDYANKANRSRSEYYNPVTVNNYRQLKAILDKRGLAYVCVQYPTRSIEPLKRIFQDNAEGVTFIDNEKYFKDAVSREGHKTYFRDMFGGDFGHCTDKGNRLLAENIANTIIKEVFHK